MTKRVPIKPSLTRRVDPELVRTALGAEPDSLPAPERGKCPSCLELAEHGVTDLKCSCVPPLDIEGWTAAERDEYYSKLPGDDRLVAGLDPLPTPAAETAERCRICRRPLGTNPPTAIGCCYVHLFKGDEGTAGAHRWHCYENGIAIRDTELAAFRERDLHLEEAARLLRICVSESPENAVGWPSLGTWIAADAERAAKGTL